MRMVLVMSVMIATVSNPDQLDGDNDDIGDVCDNALQFRTVNKSIR